MADPHIGAGKNDNHWLRSTSWRQLCAIFIQLPLISHYVVTTFSADHALGANSAITARNRLVS